MTDQPAIPTPGIEGFQVYKTDLPTHKVIRFLTALGSVEMMASKKWLIDIGQAMLKAAEGMTDPS
jgi:hypothetical protein